MLHDLNPFSNGNGLSGIYKTSEGECCFGVILTEGLNEKALSQVQYEANTEVTELRRAQKKTGLFQNLKSLAGINFPPPNEIKLSPDEDVSLLVKDHLDRGVDFVITSNDRKLYAQACAAIGITRADHLSCAETHAVNSVQNAPKQYVAGEAHKLRDAFIKIRPKLDNLQHDPYRAHLAETTDEIIAEIPKATKFQLGKVVNEPLDPKLKDNPWLLRLPFKSCLFEMTMPHADKEDGDKVFVLATEDEKDLFSAHILGFGLSQSGQRIPKIAESMFMWDISGEKPVFGYMGYAPAFMEDPEIVANQVNAVTQALMPFIANLNDMRSELQLVTSGKKRVQVGKDERSPLYDYHVVMPKTREVGTDNENEEDADPKRLHSRRGHYRTYSHPRYTKMQGQRVWIEDKTWGDEAKGTVGKEYDLSE